LTGLNARRSLDAMTTYPVRSRRWTRAEYDRMIDIGVLDEDERIELLGGELVVREPQGSPHYTAIMLVDEALRVAFGPGWFVRTHGPVALDDDSEPEPDVSVVPGGVRDYSREHPARPVLIVEVTASRSRLTFDRAHKGSLYARAGLADYWIVNLIENVLEVYRTPVTDDSAPFGWHYASREVLSSDASATPLAAPHARIVVRDLLP
jgi:Uma2 family endonuclease